MAIDPSSVGLGVGEANQVLEKHLTPTGAKWFVRLVVAAVAAVCFGTLYEYLVLPTAILFRRTKADQVTASDWWLVVTAGIAVFLVLGIAFSVAHRWFRGWEQKAIDPAMKEFRERLTHIEANAPHISDVVKATDFAKAKIADIEKRLTKFEPDALQQMVADRLKKQLEGMTPAEKDHFVASQRPAAETPAKFVIESSTRPGYNLEDLVLTNIGGDDAFSVALQAPDDSLAIETQPGFLSHVLKGNKGRMVIAGAEFQPNNQIPFASWIGPSGRKVIVRWVDGKRREHKQTFHVVGSAEHHRLQWIPDFVI